MVLCAALLQVNGVLHVHLPDGPTAHYKITNVVLGKDIKVRTKQETHYCARQQHKRPQRWASGCICVCVFCGIFISSLAHAGAAAADGLLLPGFKRLNTGTNNAGRDSLLRAASSNNRDWLCVLCLCPCRVTAASVGTDLSCC
jgi:hypothetical protein